MERKRLQVKICSYDDQYQIKEGEDKSLMEF